MEKVIERLGDERGREGEGKECLSQRSKSQRTRVGDDEGRDTEVLSGGSSEANVVSVVVVNTALSKHGVVLNLGLTEGRAVVGDDHKLGCRL